jgi:hypothetical protein
MSSPSPFNVAREIGNNLGNTFAKVRDENAIESILSESMGTGDPQVLQNSIGKILSQVAPERQGQALQYLQNAYNNIQTKKEKAQVEARERVAAQEGGYTFGAPAQVQAQQIKNLQPAKKTQSSQPIDPEQLQTINRVRGEPGFSDLDELGQYQQLTNAGVSKENADVEAKLRGTQLTRKGQQFDKSYEAQKDFINDTTNAYKGFETEFKPRLLQMRSIPDEELVGPKAAAFLDRLGIPLGALENPGSELYQKLSQDLLKGLPETYGNRILKVEVDNFLKTIPTLVNSPDGRRLIASNMLKLGEMKEIYYNEMRRQQMAYLDNEKDFPKDFQQRIFDQVKPQIDKFNNEFVKLQEIKFVPKGTIPFFNPNGEIEFVPKEHAQWAQENGGKRIW